MTSRQVGTLTRWNTERGFGFITPQSGNGDVFVHISALPRGQKPVIGEQVSFETETASDGRTRATRVIFPNDVRLVPVSARRSTSDRKERSFQPREAEISRTPKRRSRTKSGFPLMRVLLVLLIAAAGAIGYVELRDRAPSTASTLSSPAAVRPSTFPAAEQNPGFQCDGRIHCSQMRSCEEAKFFLRNCPGTQMDGDRDGIPCESQWCSR